MRPPKKRGVHRETFSADHKTQILADGPDPISLHRDRCALRLLLVYALRKESLRQIQFSHFDHGRRRLTIFAKGGKVRSRSSRPPSGTTWNGTSSTGKHSPATTCSAAAM